MSFQSRGTNPIGGICLNTLATKIPSQPKVLSPDVTYATPTTPPAVVQPVSDDDAYTLAGPDLPPNNRTLRPGRPTARRRQGQHTVTFSPKVFIPLTHLCRDFCGYCTFRHSPDTAPALYMSPEEVLAVAKAGERLGCTEALFTLGERPEQRYPEAKQWLYDRGYETTLEYLAEVCRLVLEETALMPHANPGTMSRRELAALHPYNPSMGLMLESTSPRLYEAGGPHEFAPSKRPRVRLRTIELAGELGIPFTTGILIGIGETRRERVEALLAIRDLHRAHGHIQEVIIQNFRAKPATPMAGCRRRPCRRTAVDGGRGPHHPGAGREPASAAQLERGRLPQLPVRRH